MTTTLERAAATAPSSVAGRRPIRVGRTVANVIAVIWAVVWVFPIYWMVSNALRPTTAIGSGPDLLPTPFTVSNFHRVLSSSDFWAALRMSSTIALLTVVVALVTAFFAAIAISRFRFRGRKGVIIAVVVIQMIPAEALFVSQYKMLDAWSLLNSAIGMTLLYAGANIPFTVWMLKGFVDNVPQELEQAAMIDGCSRFSAFIRISLPLLWPGLVAAGIFSFLAAWNEFTLALVILTNREDQTLPLWLGTFQPKLQGTDWGGMMAGSTVMALPVVILFAFVQKRIAEGMVGGAVKG